MPFFNKFDDLLSTTVRIYGSGRFDHGPCHGSYQPHNNPTAGRAFFLSLSPSSLYLSMAAGNGQLNGSTFGARKIWPAARASNFKAGERGKGKEGMPAYAGPAFRPSRLPKWALIILNRSLPASSVFEIFCLGKTRSTSPSALFLPPPLSLMRALISMCGGARGFSSGCCRGSSSKRTGEVDGATK